MCTLINLNLLTPDTALGLGMVIPSDSNQPAEPLPIGQMELNWTEIKQPLVFDMESTTYNRLLIRLNLQTVFPLLSNLANHSSVNIVTEMANSRAIRPSPHFDCFLFTTSNEAYLLASFRQPTNLQLNFDLDTYFFGQHFQKSVTVNNKIISIGYPVEFVFTFTVTNTNLTQMLASEFNVLNYFRKNLWRKLIFFVGADNYNLDIISFKPYRKHPSHDFDFSKYTFEIGSSEGPSARLNSLLAFKNDNAEHCATARNEELNAFTQETSLEMDLCSVSLAQNSFNYTKDTDYTADIGFVVRIFDSSIYMIGDRITVIIYALASTLVLCVVLCGVYRLVQNYSNCLSKNVGHK